MDVKAASFSMYRGMPSHFLSIPLWDKPVCQDKQLNNMQGPNQESCSISPRKRCRETSAVCHGAGEETVSGDSARELGQGGGAACLEYASGPQNLLRSCFLKITRCKVTLPYLSIKPECSFPRNPNTVVDNMTTVREDPETRPQNWEREGRERRADIRRNPSALRAR